MLSAETVLNRKRLINMNSFCNSEEKTDVSDSCQIFHRKNIQMSQINLTVNSLDQRNNAQNANKNMEFENIQTMKKCALWYNENKKFTKLKLILNSLEQVSENGREVLSNTALRKLRIMLVINAANKCKYSPINSKQIQEDIRFLDISDDNKCELNDSEKLEVKSLVEAKLREDIHDFIVRYNDLGGNVKEIPKNVNNVNSKSCQNNELEILNWKKKIDEIYTRYEKHLVMICKLLTEWSQNKNELNEARFKNTEHILLHAQLIETQTNISKLSCNLRMFLESPASINAFKILNMNLETKIHQIDSEIQRKANLKKEYEDLKCTEYDEIFKKYTDVCNAIKKKKILFDRL